MRHVSGASGGRFHPDFLSVHQQKYLRRFYGLPVGLQGGRGTSGDFQTKIKEMQRFFKLEVSSRSNMSPSAPELKQVT